jgi:hypothetical protein
LWILPRRNARSGEQEASRQEFLDGMVEKLQVAKGSEFMELDGVGQFIGCQPCKVQHQKCKNSQ